jgi:hypothetical protein
MRSAALVAALLVASAAAASGCDVGGSDPSPDAELTVYVSVPDGRAGDGIKAGVLRALADADGMAGGVAVRPVLETTAPRPATIAAHARRAVEDSTSIAYIGELDSTSTLSSLPITNDARMLQVSPTAGASDLVAPFEGSDDVPPETQSSGERTFGTLADLHGTPRQLGEEAMALVLDAIDRADDPLDRASVVDAFFEPGERDSPLGTITIDEVGRAQPGA